MMRYLLIVLLFLTGCASQVNVPNALLSNASQTDLRLIETRYCGEPARDAVTNKVLRDSKVTTAFRAQNPCPATGLTKGACPDWQMDHIKPLDNGGCDAVSNMQWLPTWLKTCAGHCKDRWERLINCKPVEDGGTGCANSIIKPKE